MKRRTLLSLTILCLFLNFSSKAALPNGTTAPDWTLTDLDGNTHHLYDILASGRHVVLDFSATWCAPCWNYHNTGTLETLWDLYGPGGSNEIMVFFVEGDGDTNTACLYGQAGCNDVTQGNWVATTDYPIFNLEGPDLNITSQYQITYWPTLYAISANTYEIYEVGQETVTGWTNWLFQSFNLTESNSSTPSICPEEGAIDLSVSGGYNSISYAWSNGMNTEDLTGLNPGTYNCTISDYNGYEVETGPITVGGPANGPMMMNLSALNNVSCNGDPSGYISVTGNGGNGGTNYTWSNGSNGPVLQNATAGYYTVSMTDVQGCVLSQSYTITEPPALTNEAATVAEACENQNGEIYLFTNGGVGPYTYNIGNGPVSVPYFLGLSAGEYNVAVTDQNGCVINESITIAAEDGPVAAASSSGDLSCTDIQITISSAGSTSGSDISYTWSTSDGNIVSGASENEAIVDAAGTYILNVLDTSTGCESTDEITISSSSEAPMVDIASAEMITCVQTVVTLDGSASSSGSDITYEWTDASGNSLGSESTLDVMAAGTYTFTVLNTANGCTSSEDITVEENTEIPSISVPDGVLSCSVTSIEICADIASGNEVSWTTPEGNETGNCITVTMAGDYIAEVAAANGCNNVATSVITTSADLPQIDIASPESLTCTIEELTLEGMLDGDINDFSINWTTTDGNIISGQSTLEPLIDAPGTYTLSVENTTSGCVSTLTATVEEEILLPTAEYQFELNDGTLELEGLDLGLTDNVSWDLGNGSMETGETLEVELGETGHYSVCMTVTNDCGSTTTCEEIFFVSRLTWETESSDIICHGLSEGTLEVIPSGGLPDYSILWSGPDGFTSDAFVLDNLPAGSYTMELMDDYGYVKTESYEIDEPEELIIVSHERLDVDCFGGSNGSIFVEVEGGVADYTYSWSNGGMGAINENLIAGEYTLEVMDNNGCLLEAIYEITEPQEIVEVSSTIQDDTNGTASGSIIFNAAGGTGSLTYEWDNGLTGNSISGLEAGAYQVIVTDANNCSKEFGPFVVNDITGVEDLDFVHAFDIYPNPAVNYINVEVSLNTSESNHIRIINSTGKTVFFTTFAGKSIETQIDVRDLAAGIYLIEFGHLNQRATERFLVVK